MESSYAQLSSTIVVVITLNMRDIQRAPWTIGLGLVCKTTPNQCVTCHRRSSSTILYFVRTDSVYTVIVSVYYYIYNDLYYYQYYVLPSVYNTGDIVPFYVSGRCFFLYFSGKARRKIWKMPTENTIICSKVMTYCLVHKSRS